MMAIKWSITSQPVFNTMQIVGYCDDSSSEIIMLNQAASWIEVAIQDFNALPISEPPTHEFTSACMLSCRLLFENKEHLSKFLEYMSES